MKLWWVYLIHCQDGSLYCGCTNQPNRRWQQHQLGQGARYTRAKGVKEMRLIAQDLSQREALQYEYQVKQLSRLQKWQLWETGQALSAALAEDNHHQAT